MFDRVLEWAAAQKDQRFQLYREARLAYEAYLTEHAVPFDGLTEEDYQRAAVDARLQAAERGYREALGLTRPSGATHDVAVALSQLGMLLHLCKRFSEARDAFHEAVLILEDVAQVGSSEQQVLSCCHYHLGLLNLKEGHYAAARRRLKISLALDEELGDLAGTALGRSALSRCPSGDDGSPEPPYTPSRRPLIPAREAAPVEPEPDGRAAEGESLDIPGPFAATTREALWIMAASETSVSQLRDLAQKACPEHRELVLFTAAAESGALDPPPMPPGTSLCGAILEISSAALASCDFRYWTAWCINRACETADFRLFIHLKDISETAFVELADHDTLIGELRDKVQMHQPESLDSLEKDLRTHLLRLELTRDLVKWRWIRRFGIRLVGAASSLVLWLLIAFWLGVSAGAVLLGKARVIAALVPLAPARDWIGILGGVPLVWANLIPLTMLMQGWKLKSRVLVPTPSRIRWFLFGWAVSNASLWLPVEIHCSPEAILLGATLGLLLETSRRGKANASRRNLLRVGQAIAGKSSVPGSIMQPGRADPKEWPLFVSGSKVFISYSRSSEWGSECADLLHERVKSVGSDSFLDRRSIPPGASWQYQLDEQIGEAAVFVALCDENSVRRPWVAAELAAALAGRHTSGFPEIILLKKPSLTPAALASALPVFRAAVGDAENGSEGAPRVITVRDTDSITNLVSTLAPSRFKRRAVFPEGFRLLLLTLATPVMFLTTLLPILGLPALLLGIGAQFGKIDLHAWFRPSTLWWLAVVNTYALGVTIRQAIGARYDGMARQRGRSVFATMRLSAIGFALLAAHLLRHVDAVGVVWAVAALWLGWIVTFAYIGGVSQGRRYRPYQLGH